MPEVQNSSECGKDEAGKGAYVKIVIREQVGCRKEGQVQQGDCKPEEEGKAEKIGEYEAEFRESGIAERHMLSVSREIIYQFWSKASSDAAGVLLLVYQ